MNYNTYPYGIFNPQYLSQFQAQQMEAQRNLEQQKNICDMPTAGINSLQKAVLS